MSIDFSNLFNRNTNMDAARMGNSSAINSVPAQTQVKSAQELNLSPGTTIQGQVVSSDGENVSIRLADQSLIEAKLDANVNLQTNSNVYFEVNGVSSNGQIVLRSLFQNTAMGQTAQNALMQAGITPNENSLGMVSSMMENGMPIDKQALQSMYRQVVSHPELSGANVVSMNRLNLPLTDSNIQQFQAYLNLEHQISEGVDHIADSTLSLLKELGTSGEQNLQTVAGQLLDVFADSIDAETMEAFFKQDSVVLEENQIGSMEQDVTLSKNVEESMDVSKRLEAAFAKAMGGSEQVDQAVSEASKVDSSGPLSSVLKELGVNEESVKTLLSDEKHLLDFAKTMLEKASLEGDTKLTQGLTKLLSDDDFGKALKGQMTKQWLMEPDVVADKEAVEGFYEKLREQTGRLATTLSQVLPDQATLAKELTNLHDNLDFMHQMNQTMSYIQLPLKLNGDSAHGDLYVYTNKKHLASEDGNVSAFLRLDMEHLGPVDVYIAMQNQNVSTNFYLKDDEIIDLIADNIHILNERLEAQGYHMNATITQKEEKVDGGIMQEILEDHKDNMLIGTKSFDVRA